MMWIILLLSIIGGYGCYILGDIVNNGNLFHDYVQAMDRIKLGLICTAFSISGLIVMAMINI